jgi:outer membrane autotransporter protein
MSNTLFALEIIDGRERTIDQSTIANDYDLRNNATLNVIGGVQHGKVSASSSTVNVAAGSALTAIAADQSTIFLQGGAVTSRGIALTQSNANIASSSVTNTAGIGLSLARFIGIPTGSKATVTDSSITGTTLGATVSHFSELDLVRSQVTGNGATGVGLRLAAGLARATESSLVGTVNGVLMSTEADTNFQSSLTLNATRVEGQTGAAILVDSVSPAAPKAEATINVNNGSILIGGNGNILEVKRGSTATMNLNNSNQTGNVLAEAASTLNFNLNNSKLNGNVRLTGASTGTIGMSQGSMTGNVLAEGGSTLTLNLNNSDMNGNVQLTGASTGTIGMNQGSMTGNVLVDDTSTATVNLSQSRMSGDVIAESGGVADVNLNGSLLTGRLVNTSSVALNSGSQWVMVEDSTVQNLAMNGSSVKFGDPAAFYRLSVDNLSGNGTFMMDVDFGGAKTDFLNITGTASGSHSLLIGSTGTDPVNDTSLHVVHAAAGDASFSLLGGPVDLGTWSYGLVKQGENDWYLDTSTKTISPGTRTVLALFNTAPTVWYGELSTLRTRMGELRINGERSGGWMRTYGNKFNVADASGFGYKQVQQGISLGADGKLPVGDGQWLAGVMAGQSKSDLDLDRGTNGKVDSYYVGAYSTWLDSETGYYFDGVLKFNRFQNKAKVNLSDGTRTKGDYNNSGVGASLEFGRHIKLDNDYYVEPYTQLAGVVIEGKDYHLDNGMRAEGDRTRSLLGKVGATVGRNFDLGKGRTVQPYVRTALAHEFAKNNDVQVNDNVFHNDLSGSRGELGTGIAVALSDRFEVHADFEYSKGKDIEQPWGANIGVRYNW